jgi:hypothetical protein
MACRAPDGRCVVIALIVLLTIALGLVVLGGIFRDN